jgi:hypothetical protein
MCDAALRDGVEERVKFDSAPAPHEPTKKVPRRKVVTAVSTHHPTYYQSFTNMPPYDSESSDEGEDYTETNVLLGYASKESTGDAISHLGGVPVRMI